MNKCVVKHSGTVQITNRINLLQRKAWNVLLANAYNDLPKHETFQISEHALKDELKIKTRNRKHLQEIFLALMTCVIEFNYLGKDKKHSWKASTLLADAGIEDGICTYEYSSFLRKILYKPEIYARISLSLQNKFKSKHTLALYELAADYYIKKRREGHTDIISIDEFRALMGIEEGQYSRFTDLNRFVIKSAIFEINEKSDLFINVEYQREYRKTTSLQFHIKPNQKKKNHFEMITNNELLTAIETAEQEQIQTTNVKKENIKLDVSNLNEILNLIPVQHQKESLKIIKSYLNYTEKLKRNIQYVNEKNPDDYCAYLASALKNNYAEKYIPEQKKYSEFKQDAVKCFKNCNGNCSAIWPRYEKNIESNCYWCSVFEKQRDKK